MKKLIKFLCILSLVSLILAGCGSSAADESNANKAAKAFGKEFYTVDSQKIDKFNALMKINDLQSFSETMKSNDKAIKALMTEDAYNNLVNNRENLVNVQACAAGNYSMQVTDFTLMKNDGYDIKKNEAGYNYQAKLKFVSNKDKTEQTDVGEGSIVLTKQNGQWKVSEFKMTVMPKALLQTH